MRTPRWRGFKGAILHQLMSKGVNRGMHSAWRPPAVTQENSSAARLTKGGMILNWFWKIGSSHTNRWRKYLGNRVFHCQFNSTHFSLPQWGGFFCLTVVTSYNSYTKYFGRVQTWAKEWSVFAVDHGGFLNTKARLASVKCFHQRLRLIEKTNQWLSIAGCSPLWNVVAQ